MGLIYSAIPAVPWVHLHSQPLKSSFFFFLANPNFLDQWSSSQKPVSGDRGALRFNPHVLILLAGENYLIGSLATYQPRTHKNIITFKAGASEQGAGSVASAKPENSSPSSIGCARSCVWWPPCLDVGLRGGR